MTTTTRPHSILHRLLLAIAALLFAGAVFASWHTAHYAMGAAAPRVLIITESSEYKDAVTAGLVEHLKGRSAAVQQIDLGGLAAVQPAQWKAIVLIHTWEMGAQPTGVQDFIDRLPSRDRLVVHTTSGQGDGKAEGVDAVSGASTMEDVPAKVQELAKRVDVLLAK